MPRGHPTGRSVGGILQKMRSRRAATEARAGQASEAGGGAAGGQNGGGGGTLEDPFHSTQTPCCRRGLELVSGIFPEVAEGGAGSSSLSGEGSQAPAGSSAQQQQLADDGGGPESNILALVVRQHLLNERRNRGGGGGRPRAEAGRGRRRGRRSWTRGWRPSQGSATPCTTLEVLRRD